MQVYSNELSNAENKPSGNEQAINLSSGILNFLNERQKHLQKISGSGDSTIRISEILGSIALFYERIRNIVEYKGEYVLRRNAIERMMKRLLWAHTARDIERVSSTLIRELVWAKYLPNDTIPKSKIHEVAKVIHKYVSLLNGCLMRSYTMTPSQIKTWIWGVASCEIEEVLDPSIREPYVQLMFSWFKTYFKWQDLSISDQHKDIQIYLAIHRALVKSDAEIMRYHLLLKFYPKWKNATSEDVQQLIVNFSQLYETIETELEFPNNLLLYRRMQKYTAPFEIFHQLVKEDGLNIKNTLSNEQIFNEKVRDICRRKYARIQQKVNSGIIRSIVYIFLTKVVLALLIEIPYELYRFGRPSYIPIGINVVLPPLLMFMVGLTIRAPGDDNTRKILTRLKYIIYENPYPQVSNFSVKQKSQNSPLNRIFTFLYFISSLFIFAVITYFLLKIHFTFVGIAIFFIFLSLVLLFGFRVKYTSLELKVTSDKENLFEYLLNNLSLPFLNTGVYLSKGLAKINFLASILDFLIEAPLKTVIEVFEEWTSFMREKREEAVEIPNQ